jgi:hypothetical protein
LRRGGYALHQIRLIKQRDGRHYWTPARLIFLEREAVADIESLIDSLLAIIDKESSALEGLLLPTISSLMPGLYLLSSSAPFLKPDMCNDGIEELNELGPIN